MLWILFEILTSDDMEDYASYAIVFYGRIKKWLKLGQKTDNLAHFESFFVDALLHPIHYAPRFCQLKDLIKIIFVISFSSIAFVVVKLKVSKDLASMKYSSILLKFWPELVSNKKNIAFKKSFKILHFGSNETRSKFIVLVHF